MDVPWVREGPINGGTFTTYLTQFLVPPTALGDVLITDTQRQPKRAATCKAICCAEVGFIFLPPCAAELNPIE